MTKHLLTALLIAGFSVTAKAEPTVYYCNTISFGQSYEEAGVGHHSKIKEERFKLFVDIANKTVRVASSTGLWPVEIVDGQPGEHLMLKPRFGEGAFLGTTIGEDNKPNGIVGFKDSVFTYSTIGLRNTAEGEFLVSSYIAQCDKF